MPRRREPPVIPGGYYLIVENDRGQEIERIYRKLHGGGHPKKGYTIELPTGVYEVYREPLLRDDPEMQTQDVYQLPFCYVRRVGAPIPDDSAPKPPPPARKGGGKIVPLPSRSSEPRASSDPDFAAITGADVLPLGLVLGLVTLGYKLLVDQHEEQKDALGDLVRVDVDHFVDSSLIDSLQAYTRRAKRLYAELAMRCKRFEQEVIASASDQVEADRAVDAPSNALLRS